MPRNILYKLGFIVGIAAFSLFLAYPPSQQINLGLDLRGGIHLVLEVDLEEAVAGQVRDDFSRFQILLTDEGVPPAEVRLDNDTMFSVSFNSEAEARRADDLAGHLASFPSEQLVIVTVSQYQ